MTAVPMTLEHQLHHLGYTIDEVETAAFTIPVAEVGGVIEIPAMVTSVLTWRRVEPPILGDDLYLSSLPLFDELYRPVLLSSILDRYRTRRLGYNTPGEWRLAFRRWGNLNMSPLNRRYISTAVALPLDDQDSLETIAATQHGLDIGSDFPQSLIAGGTDYATEATDRRVADNSTNHRTGRNTSIMRLLEEQRATYLNVDAEVIAGLDSLFLGLLDQGESGSQNMYAPPPGGYPYGRYSGLAPYGW